MTPAHGTESFALVVRFHLRAEHEAAFDELAARTIAAIAEHEPGTLLYVSHRAEEQPLLRVFYELYADRAAFAAHENQPHVRHFLAEREPLVERVEVDWLTPAAIADARGALT